MNFRTDVPLHLPKIANFCQSFYLCPNLLIFMINTYLHCFAVSVSVSFFLKNNYWSIPVPKGTCIDDKSINLAGGIFVLESNLYVAVTRNFRKSNKRFLLLYQSP